MVSTIFFDFGGCIDAPGIHTRTLFWDAFVAEGADPGGRAAFQEAYTLADQRMMSSGEAKKMPLETFNRHNATLIAGAIGFSHAQAAGDRVTALMRGYIANSRQALLPLKGKFELGIISNFTGNLEVILREFQLRDLFESVTESYYAGASKPDLRIFQAALAQTKSAPVNCVYIGDNPKNDIAPAKALGMKAVLIHPSGARQECGADYYVEDLNAFSSWIQKR
ncbi:MAG: HAD family hydrolase [Bdellovibrionota bacterium]